MSLKTRASQQVMYLKKRIPLEKRGLEEDLPGNPDYGKHFIPSTLPLNESRHEL